MDKNFQGGSAVHTLIKETAIYKITTNQKILYSIRSGIQQLANLKSAEYWYIKYRMF